MVATDTSTEIEEQIVVVVPFFQHKQGLLRRALISIANQSYKGSILAIVVDDASPTGANQEIAGLSHQNFRIEVIRQPNSGPGAARNCGLSHVPEYCCAVAFLDSDDVWTQDHLSNALDALKGGCDFYFSNHLEPDAEISAFSEHGRLNLTENEPLNSDRGTYYYRDDMVSQIVRSNVIETSTVVFLWSKYSRLRFDPGLRYSFEDHLFWLELASSAQGIAFGSKPEAIYGKGVSIWRSSNFMSENVFKKIHSELLFRTKKIIPFLNTSDQICWNKIHLNSLRKEFAAALAHRIRRPRRFDVQTFFRILILNPTFWMKGILEIYNIFLRKFVKASHRTA